MCLPRAFCLNGRIFVKRTFEISLYNIPTVREYILEIVVILLQETDHIPNFVHFVHAFLTFTRAQKEYHSIYFSIRSIFHINFIDKIDMIKRNKLRRIISRSRIRLKYSLVCCICVSSSKIAATITLIDILFY